MGCHFLLQGIFPTQGSNPSSALQANSFTAEPSGKLLERPKKKKILIHTDRSFYGITSKIIFTFFKKGGYLPKDVQVPTEHVKSCGGGGGSPHTWSWAGGEGRARRIRLHTQGWGLPVMCEPGGALSPLYPHIKEQEVAPE